MDDRIDNTTKDALLDAMERIKDFSRQLKDKREQKLWKEIIIPCSLLDAVSALSKSDMDRIRKNLDLKNLSSLKKADLAKELAKLIPLKFKQVIYTFDRGRYGLIKVLAGNSGVITDIDILSSQAEAFMGYGIAFPGTYNNHKVLFMPPELVNIFLQIDDTELERELQRNTEWIRLTHGLLYYYGVMDSWLIKEKIQKLTGTEIDFLEFWKVISVAMNFYGQVKYSPYGLRDHRVFDAEKIADEHKMRPNVDYYPFTKKQLLKAGNPDYIDRTPAMNNFIGFLSKYYDLNNEEIDEIALHLIDMINMDSKPTAIIQYLQSFLEFPSFDFIQELTGRIMELYNNTRQWVLKGHTPDELFQEEKKYLRPLPAEPFRPDKEKSNVIDIRTRTKVGRNSPCPCGSGKKYKKCCGKNEG